MRFRSQNKPGTKARGDQGQVNAVPLVTGTALPYTHTLGLWVTGQLSTPSAFLGMSLPGLMSILY